MDGSRDDAERLQHALGVHAGDVLLGKYRIDGQLGSGAMGLVLSATHVGLGERVALKILRLGAGGAQAVQRFQREARAAAQIESDHVVRVMDVGTLDNGLPFIVMEHLEGGDLASFLQKHGAVSVKEAADIVIQACDVLAEAHARGIIHRDLKPSNMFLAKRFDGSASLKVLDFGVSKLLSPSIGLTATAALVGSPPYMSPEQIRSSKDVNHRTDIWSLGVILFELLAGRRPFDAPSQPELFELISRSSPPGLACERPDIPEEIEVLIMECLTKDLERRIPDVGEVALRLAPFASSRTRPLVERVVRVVQGRLGAEERPDEMQPKDSTTTRPLATQPVDPPRSSDDATASEDSVIPASDPLVGTLLGGSFRIERFLGKGAMGAVYAATTGHGEHFAIKVLNPDVAAGYRGRARLVREAKTAARLKSKHVVRILDTRTDEQIGGPFIVMELLEGRDLARFIRETGRMDPTACVHIFLQVCNGLSEAHAHGLVHRDVKPANVFLHEEQSGEIIAKICDFGIAKLADEHAAQSSSGLTGSGLLLGSPLYMSPEQAKNAKRVDRRTDIWSLCISMYEALSGKNPWAHCSTPGELIVALCTQDVRPLAGAAPWLDRSLVAIIQRGLRRDPDERWGSVDDLATALRPFADGEERCTRERLIPSDTAGQTLSQLSIDVRTEDGSGLRVANESAVLSRVPATKAAGKVLRRIGLLVGSAMIGAAIWVTAFVNTTTPIVSSKARRTGGMVSAAMEAVRPSSDAPSMQPTAVPSDGATPPQPEHKRSIPDSQRRPHVVSEGRVMPTQRSSASPAQTLPPIVPSALAPSAAPSNSRLVPQKWKDGP